MPMPLIENFTIGFWHPFGPHGGETAEEILVRKQKEIDANGWTFWSFQFRHTLCAWHNEIKRAEPQRVLVFCSEGKGAKDPARKTQLCSSYHMVNEEAEHVIPNTIRIPHPLGKKNRASAFVVKEIITPHTNSPAFTDIELFSAEWYRKNGIWEDASIPTRGEYLIRRGGQEKIRRYRAILVLKEPWLATVSTLPPENADKNYHPVLSQLIRA